LPCVLALARQGESRDGDLDHDVVVVEGTNQPTPDAPLLAVGQQPRHERPVARQATRRTSRPTLQPPGQRNAGAQARSQRQHHRNPNNAIEAHDHRSIPLPGLLPTVLDCDGSSEDIFHSLNAFAPHFSGLLQTECSERPYVSQTHRSAHREKDDAQSSASGNNLCKSYILFGTPFTRLTSTT
jgi:hypothetical protein